jgi:uncharacterized membrane protein YgdD (TMEM256/DUF423 family)
MNWIVVGAVSGFLAVACGAFGAHGLKARVAEPALAWWNTAAHYQLTHALALVAVGVWGRRRPRSSDVGPEERGDARLHAGPESVAANAAGWAFLLGSAVFCGSLYAMTLGAPRWFGAITPVGGVLLLAGWALLAWAARGLAR